MSDIGKLKVDSILPDNIEEKIRETHSTILGLIHGKEALQKEVDDKRAEYQKICTLLDGSNVELLRVEKAAKDKARELTDREEKVSQKESALNVYANALKVKEEKLSKYLSVFDRMKDAITK